MLFRLLLTTSLFLSTQALAAPSIAGGRLVPEGHALAKSTVGLKVKFKDGPGICTGSILDQDIILTAAHCVAGALPNEKSIQITFGTRMFEPEHVRFAKRVFIPAGYTKDLTPDIALIYFEGGLPLGYDPAEIVSHSQQPEKGEAVIVAGYGVTHRTASDAGVLREVNQFVAYTETPQDYEVIFTQKGKTGTCLGDSGGPAFTAQGHRLLGVSSRILVIIMPPCGLNAIYTNVSHPRMRALIDLGIGTLRTELK